ncbi:Uncharacterized protein APZ42_012298 [Daphnia magna]|uniref:Uncharacterized protein n=1 Tax=Daphnia magna TaxID=35525 RepID=A0A162RZG7_9CRUS|nr:Uncharacterized protein APZ42_012298 [Daphnia magna]
MINPKNARQLSPKEEERLKVVGSEVEDMRESMKKYGLKLTQPKKNLEGKYDVKIFEIKLL